ncbi:spliceosome complex protein [Fomitiporia mediterranea MF3/22]|uniref:spliceosome complex protein n=1 Tax=Fomitiporia mediterranea (strain MF3/22) TaxID=694068 RepID=UPI0004407ACE|nr:spliceosome complex protein [Fomitiporia mediterranea MF3/22]EJD05741.1 spliceosome complex protein [Fomitiporia mediterranea MF3/22]
MPSVALLKPTLDNLKANVTLTQPVPTPLSHPELLSPGDLTREEDLLRNPSSFRHWWAAIQATKETCSALQKAAPTSDIEPDVAALLGPLATPEARLSFQRLTYLYEAALVQFPGSFKLWKSYLHLRMSYVLGKFVQKKRAGGKKKLPEMKEALEDEKEDLEQWEGGLDGVVGYEEWKSLVATFERALMWLPNLPRLWLLYLSIFSHPMCPAAFSHSHARHTYDRALRTLPPSLHHRIWVRYLLWAEANGGLTCVAVYRRYLAVDPSVTERYVSILLSPSNPSPRPLEAAKLLLALARKAATGEYTSPEGKSPYQLLGEWLDVIEQYPEEVGVSVEQTVTNEKDKEKAAAEAAEAEKASQEPASVDGRLIRFAGPPVAVGKDGKELRPYDEDEDPTSSRRLDVERIIRTDGLEVYKDQAGRLWTGLATYWIKRGEFDRAKTTFEAGMAAALTIRDFTQIFDAYAEFSESLVSALMEALADPDEDDEDDTKETEKELDERMKAFEELMDRRPFLVNDVLLRRNPNDVQEWEKRIALWGNDDEKVAEMYTTALSTIHPKKATANLHRLFINFAKFYEEGGTTGEAERDLDSARKILEKATKVNFRTVEDLAEVWCEWAEMELRHDNYDEAIRVMQRAAVIPKNPKISYHDHSLPVQARLFKSLKLWSFYVDLEESIGTVDTTKAAYDKILELRIANAQIIINYAAFLEENKYYEESFKVYERGVELFTFPVAFEIWNIYLSKFVKRYGGSKIERARDLFEQALEQCPPKFCKALYFMYGKLEEEHGLAKRAMNIYERATQAVTDEDKFEMFTIYIAKASANFGLPATRPIYERALEVLPDKQTAQMCLRFAQLERKLGEIDRARAIYAHASQFCDPRVLPEFWTEWYNFEIDTGSEDTFREMLRIKRSVQAQFNTEASFLAAQTIAARKGTADLAAEAEEAADPMAQAEKQATGGKGTTFVAAAKTAVPTENAGADGEDVQAQQQNEDEIRISDDEDL